MWRMRKLRVGARILMAVEVEYVAETFSGVEQQADSSGKKNSVADKQDPCVRESNGDVGHGRDAWRGGSRLWSWARL